MSIKLWEVADLALPLLVIVFVQVVFIVLFRISVLFRLLGKDYDATIMVAVFTGHSLGATPNPLAYKSVVTERYAPPTKEFLIDVFAMPIILTTINLFN